MLAAAEGKQHDMGGSRGAAGLVWLLGLALGAILGLLG
jgi:hypothetical protein